MHPLITAWRIYLRIAELPYYYGTREYTWKIIAGKNAMAWIKELERNA